MSSDEDDLLSASDYGIDESDDESISSSSTLVDQLSLTMETLHSNGFLDNLPKSLELRPPPQLQSSCSSSSLTNQSDPVSGSPRLVTVTTKVDLRSGHRFGPFPGKITKDPVPQSYNWKEEHN
uniref:Uncharacterized protein n=1 Tax=Tetranychus urticae TaxID=32264 RepID=T1KMW6_TETUR